MENEDFFFRLLNLNIFKKIKSNKKKSIKFFTPLFKNKYNEKKKSLKKFINFKLKKRVKAKITE